MHLGSWEYMIAGAEPPYRRGGATASATVVTSYNSPTSFDHYLYVSDDLTATIIA
jgi:hypothetical protein